MRCACASSPLPDLAASEQTRVCRGHVRGINKYKVQYGEFLIARKSFLVATTEFLGARNLFLVVRKSFLGTRTPVLIPRNSVVIVRNSFLIATMPVLGARNPVVRALKSFVLALRAADCSGQSLIHANKSHKYSLREIAADIGSVYLPRGGASPTRPSCLAPLS